MPKRAPFDVAGIRIHDHWIRARPGLEARQKGLRFDESQAGNWRRFVWPATEQPSHVDDPGLALMAQVSRGHFERAGKIIDERPGAAAVRLSMYHHVRGEVFEALERPLEAERAYRVALALDPGLVSAAVNLGLVLTQTGRPGAARKLLTGVLAEHPLAQSALRNRALAAAALGDQSGFVADLERAFRMLPTKDVALALARSFESQGNGESAQRWRRAAHDCDPSK